jgi:hypothetical protein
MMEEIRNAYRVLAARKGNGKEVHLEHIDTDGKIILKFMFKK